MAGYGKKVRRAEQELAQAECEHLPKIYETNILGWTKCSKCGLDIRLTEALNMMITRMDKAIKRCKGGM